MNIHVGLLNIRANLWARIWLFL